MANEEDPTKVITLAESSILREDLTEYYLSDTFSDIKLILSDQDIYAHKIVLATKSKFFKSLLLKDPKQTNLILTDVRSKAFRKILKFIYTGSIALTTSDEDLIFDILKLANKYSLETLVESVLVQVSSMLNMTNVCQILNEANSCDIDKMRDICHNFIDERIEDVLESDFFNALSETSIIRLLERDEISAPEIDIFKIAAQWCKANENSGDLVTKVVRLSHLTEKEILKVVWPSKLVASDDLLAVISSMKDETIENGKDAPRNNSIFTDIEQAQKILEVSDRQLFKTLDSNVIETKKSDLNSTNICAVLNTANFYDSDLLRDACYSFIDLNLDKFVSEDCFLKLTKKSLIELLKWEQLYMPEIDIFKNVLKWCQTNNDFDKRLIECVRLNLIDLQDLLTEVRSSSIVDHEDLLQAIAEIVGVGAKTPKAGTKTSDSKELLLMDQNIATTDLKAQVISGNKRIGLLHGNKCCSHTINDQNGIVIKLGRPSRFNHIEMKLKDSDSRYYNYYIELSLDQRNWNTVIDYCSFPCRSVQQLFFEAQTAQYIRIVETFVSLKSESQFELVYFEAYFKSVVPRFVNGIVCPGDNVATLQNGAIFLEGGGNLDTECYHTISNGSIIIQLAQPYMISNINFGLESGEWEYFIETSVDKTHWETAVDRRNTNCNGLQNLRFKERPVVFIKITGVYGSIGWPNFFCNNFECFFFK